MLLQWLKTFLAKNADIVLSQSDVDVEVDLEKLKMLISKAKGYDIVMKLNDSPLAKHYASQDDLSTFATRGVLTPEHIIRTKRVPLVLEDKDIEEALKYLYR